MATPPFVPTHATPASGSRAWATPDGSGEPAARLDPGLEVQVVERKDDWAKVRCSNDWEAWVDGRRLVALEPATGAPAPPADAPSGPPTGPPAGPPTAAVTPAAAEAPVTAATATLVDVETAAPAPAAASPAGIEVRGLSILSLIGAIAIAGGSFLDWWSIGPLGTTAWDIPVKYLLTGKAGDGIDTGPILILLVVVLAVTLVIGRRLPDLVLLVVAALAIGIALAALVRGLTNDPTVYPEAGLLITMAGGALVAIDGFGFLGGRS